MRIANFEIEVYWDTRPSDVVVGRKSDGPVAQEGFLRRSRWCVMNWRTMMVTWQQRTPSLQACKIISPFLLFFWLVKVSVTAVAVAMLWSGACSLLSRRDSRKRVTSSTGEGLVIRYCARVISRPKQEGESHAHHVGHSLSFIVRGCVKGESQGSMDLWTKKMWTGFTWFGAYHCCGTT